MIVYLYTSVYINRNEVERRLGTNIHVHLQYFIDITEIKRARNALAPAAVLSLLSRPATLTTSSLASAIMVATDDVTIPAALSASAVARGQESADRSRRLHPPLPSNIGSLAMLLAMRLGSSSVLSFTLRLTEAYFRSRWSPVF